MRIKHFIGKEVRSQIERTTTVETLEYKAIFVGLRAETSAVEQIWVRADGGMVSNGRVHHPEPGRTAAGEAITTFGLSRLQRFSPLAIGEARTYAARLKRELEDDAPGIL